MTSSTLQSILLPQFGISEAVHVPSNIIENSATKIKPVVINKRNRRSYESGLATFFDMAYYLLLCPYKFQIQPGQPHSFIKKHRFQRVITFL